MPEEHVVPTKGNLLEVKKSLDLSSLGYDLLDRKRSILVRELMTRIQEVRTLKNEVHTLFAEAYRALQQANITYGVVEPLAETMPLSDEFEISFHSVMGVDLPTVQMAQSVPHLNYDLDPTNSRVDYAYVCFLRVRDLCARLAEVETSVYRLTSAIKKTQRRANALKNIIIPRFQDNVKFISDALEEKDREEFSRLKVLKKEQQNE